MNNEREKRLLLGALAFVVVLPLPFNEPRPYGVIFLPSLFVFLVFVSIFLRQAHRESEWRLPIWAMNVLGIVYLPLFYVDLRTFAGSNLVRPLIHLMMFGLLALLFYVDKEKEKRRATALIFFIFVGAMATSVHPMILVYLVAVVVLASCLLFRFAQSDLQSQEQAKVVGYERLNAGSLMAGTLVLIFVFAVPLFALMPRMRSPYVLGRGFDFKGPSFATGFQDEITLDTVGVIRGNNEVALRLKMERSSDRPPYRFRGAAYEFFRENSWLRSNDSRHALAAERGVFYRLADQAPERKMRLWLEPLRSQSLILPLGAVSVEITERIFGDERGVVSFMMPPRSIKEYRVGVGNQPVFLSDTPRFDSGDEPTLDRRDISPRIASLARLVAGDRSTERKARAIESHLMNGYEYSLDLVGTSAENPVDSFLFETRSGHCEYFATAMVMMLRAEGIPARFVTGFVGAEMNPLEDYYVIRHSNAHAWVEAWLPDSGWTTFDPTPEVGRPGGARPSLALMLRQAWDYFEFRWDRYVMAYNSLDQLDLVLRLRRFWRSFGRDSADPSPSEAPVDEPSKPTAWGEIPTEQVLPGLVLAALLVLLASIWWWRRRFNATWAYSELRRLASHRDSRIKPSTAPMTVCDRLGGRFPDAAPLVGFLVRLYLEESYSGRVLDGGQTQEARRALGRLRATLRRQPTAL
jgi:transglutaminase-like putative cysteine protease